MQESNVENLGMLNRFLNIVERLGNKLPHITMLFIYALVVALFLSLILSFIDFSYIHPNTKEKIVILNMLAPKNLLDLVVASVNNLMSFPPLGITIVATLGIGIAEGSGYVHVLLKRLLLITPKKILTPSVITVSVLCHIVSDSAYVVLMPVSALMFYACGRHPLAGIACSFAGLAGGFTASFTPSIIDPVMQRFTEAAAQSLDPSYQVNVLCNYFYALGGTVFVILSCWFVTDKIVEPRLKLTMPLNNDLENDEDTKITPLTDVEKKGFNIATATVLGLLALLAVLCYPDNSILRSPTDRKSVV